MTAQIALLEKKNPPDGIFFDGFWNHSIKAYPAWRYHKIHQPIIVQNTADDLQAQKDGYAGQWAPATANQSLVNWFWDLEDMSANQLSVFAKAEYGVDLPREAGQEKLLQAIFELAKWAPQNQGRIVLMAHTIRMNYDETLEQIRRTAEKGFTETETRVIEL